MNEKSKFPVGTKVRHKLNHKIEGVVVGKSFGEPKTKTNVRLQLTSGVTFDVSPYVLKKVDFFWSEMTLQPNDELQILAG